MKSFAIKRIGKLPMALNVTPAYGRVYLSAASALEGWNSGRDWKIRNGPYCSNRDTKFIKEKGFTHVTLDWDNNSATAVEVMLT